MEPGINLLRDERAWEKVSNTVFFNAIRMAWNNFCLVVEHNAMGSSSAKPTVRNDDVVWLENRTPAAYLNLENVVEISFSIAEVWDIQARAQKLQQLLKWQEEGAVVERWIENCPRCREPSRLALGRHLREMWHTELERQNTIRQRKPDLSNKWQPPELLEDSRFHCNDGPIGFALDVISQWHRQLQFGMRFLHTMEATVAFSPRERGNADEAADTYQVPVPPANNRGAGHRASQAPAHSTTEDTSSARPPRAQHKRAAGPQAPRRQEERPSASDSQHAPGAAHGDLGCEGCGRKGHTAEHCRCKRNPNWNTQHATIRWKDTVVVKEIQLLTKGQVRSLPPDGVQWVPAMDGLEESGSKPGRPGSQPPSSNPTTDLPPPKATLQVNTEVSPSTLEWSGAVQMYTLPCREPLHRRQCIAQPNT